MAINQVIKAGSSDRSGASASVLDTLLHIQDDWGLSDRQMGSLLHVSESFYRGAVKGDGPVLGRKLASAQGTLPAGLETAAPLICIYRKLGIKLQDAEKSAKWLQTEHPDFGGNKPIEIVASSPENLYWLSYYLDSVIGYQN